MRASDSAVGYAAAAPRLPSRRTLCGPLQAVLLECARRIHSWRLPPNWSATDWADEVYQILDIAGWRAVSEFDAAFGIPLPVFLYQRAIARALTRYRQEWAYGLHFRSPCAQSLHRHTGSFEDAEPRPTVTPHPAGGSDADTDCEALAEAVATLPERSRRLILLLFWEGHTECETAAILGVSQPAINKRKHAALGELRRQLEARRSAE